MDGIDVDGNSNLLDYSVQESATPLNPGDISASFGQVTYTTNKDDARLEEVKTLHDRGKIWINPSTVRELSYTDGLVSVTADAAMSVLNRWYTVPPFSGSLRAYLNVLSNITGAQPPIAADPSISDQQVVAVGYEGNVWEGFKEFLSANNFEATYDTGRIWVQPPHQNVYRPNHLTSLTRVVSSDSTAEIIKVPYYELVYPRVFRNIEVFPNHDDYSEDILSVEAGETIVVEVVIEGSLSSVNQPVCVETVLAHTDYSNTNGVYSVAGDDGKPILPSRWKAGGGSLSVRLTDDPSVLEVVLVGSKVEEYAPYRIAMTAGESSYYNSLHITGDGLRWKEKSISMHTGAPRPESERETETTVENRQVLSRSQAYDVALRASRSLCGGDSKVSGSSAFVGPNAGDRLWFEDAYYRTESLTETPNDISFELDRYTLIRDYNTSGANHSFRSFNQKWSGQRFFEFNERPLK